MPVVELAATDAGVVFAMPGGLAWINELAPVDRPAGVLWKGSVRSVAVHDGAIWFVAGQTGQLFRLALDSAGRPEGLAEESERIALDGPIRRVFSALPGTLFVLDPSGDLLHYRTHDGSLVAKGILKPDEALLGTLSAGTPVAQREQALSELAGKISRYAEDGRSSARV